MEAHLRNKSNWNLGYCNTALRLASKYGNVEAIELLIKHSALVNPPLTGPTAVAVEDTPLFLACRHGRCDAAVVLLQHGAHIHLRDKVAPSS